MTRAGSTGGADLGAVSGLLDRQETLFVRLDALSRRQSRLVRDEETDGLLRVLGERQTLVEALEEASRDLDPYRARWEELLASARPELRARLQGQVERLAELAAEIAARDDSDRLEMQRRRDLLAEDLAGVRRVRGAVSAYGAANGAAGGRPAAKFQDREG